MTESRILVADDDEVSRDMLCAALNGWGYETIAVDNGEAAAQILSAGQPPRIAVIDWMMPGVKGPEICRAVRRGITGRYVYMILLTANTHHDACLAGLEAGADDFLTKPFHPDELRLRLKTGDRILDLHDRLQAAHDTLLEKLHQDIVTGIASREVVLQSLDAECLRAKSQETSFCVMAIDVDRFKQVNDVHGHPAGDAALRQVAQIIKSETLPDHVVGRLGGDEFMVVLPNLSLEQTRQTAERIRVSAATNHFPVRGRKVRLTVSIGLACSAFCGSLTAESVLEAADDALYAAKRLGRDCVSIAEPESTLTENTAC